MVRIAPYDVTASLSRARVREKIFQQILVTSCVGRNSFIIAPEVVIVLFLKEGEGGDEKAY